jgi:hypothetical protein
LAIFARVFFNISVDIYASHPITGTRSESRLALFNFIRPSRTISFSASALVDMLGKALINKDHAKRQYSKFLYDFKYLYDFCVRTAS